MENSALAIYKAIGAVQNVISNAQTLDEAIQGCLKTIVDNSGADSAVLWYADKAGDGTLHPYFWLGPVDLTRRSHAPGNGAVGRVVRMRDGRTHEVTVNRNRARATDLVW